MLAKRMTGRRYGATDPTSATQRIMLTVNVLLVYPTHSEGNQATWLLPLPFPRAFVSQITLQWGNILLCSLISKHITPTHSHSIPLEWEYHGIKGTLPESQTAGGLFEVSKCWAVNTTSILLVWELYGTLAVVLFSMHLFSYLCL